MLFNSYTFLFAFLPVTLGGFFGIARFGKAAGACWLALCSLFFYGWWDYHYLALLLASICGNYVVGRYIAAYSRSKTGKWLLAIAIASNLTLLAYYKYADFFLSTTNTLLGTSFPLLKIILPIGISFFTFTQIAFLADSYAGKVAEVRFTHYLLFVTYFPHLIAGPVLHHEEMMPQFDDDRNFRASAANLAIGFTIFAIGLAKKVLIADSLASYVAPVFSMNAVHPTFFTAWGGALAYTFQLYFDFSGYSDMAIGISILFGIRLPLNFNSPYKSLNIAEFWRRWHMTLSRFLRDYLYIPLGGNRCSPSRRHVNLITTMVLGGLWHGAGWTFVVWGGLHGSFLVVYQLWNNKYRTQFLKVPLRVSKVFSGSLTFCCVVCAWVYFRAPDITTANRILGGMFGHWGASIPETIMGRIGPLRTVAETLHVGAYFGGGANFAETWGWIVIASAIAFLCPNTQEIMACAERKNSLEKSRARMPERYEWRPNRRFAFWTGLLLAFGVLALSRPTEFLYFQF